MLNNNFENHFSPRALPRSLALSIATLLCAALAAAVPSGVTAWAGPADDRQVATSAHVDSPKVFWEGKNFALHSEFKGALPRLEETVNYVGHGWDAFGETPLHMFQIPSDPQFASIGSPGQILYAAPKVAGPQNSPIFSGFGADANIPVEGMRDSSFNLELVGFTGPGDVDLFTWAQGWPLTHMLSSHVKGLNQAWITPGQHTHNITTFTKPGSYELTYRVTARDKKGRFIASKPQMLRWQAGGTQPSKDGLGDVATAFNASQQTGQARAYRFSLSPRPDPEKSGEDQETLMKFETGNDSDQGTVVFYLDGYFLAEVPVKAGTGQFSEVLGSTESDLQAVYIPNSSGNNGDRFVTAPVKYAGKPGTGETTDAGTFPKPKRGAQTYDTADIAATSGRMTIELKPSGAGDGSGVIHTNLADPRVSARVVGGLYESADEKYESCPIDFMSTPGHRDQVVTWDGCDNGKYFLKLQIIPTTRTNLGVTNTEPEQPDLKRGMRTEVQMPQAAFQARTTDSLEPMDAAADFAPTPPSPSGDPEVPPSSGDPDTPPSSGDPNTPPSSNPPTKPGGSGGSEKPPATSSKLESTPVEIATGHVDIAVYNPSAQHLGIAVGDDSRTHANQAVLRKPSAVALRVKDNTRVKRSGRIFAGSAFDFLGPTGTQLYALGQTQERSKVWPGFSTERVNYQDFPKGVQLTLKSRSIPEGGKWWAFEIPAGFNSGVEHIASADKPGVVDGSSPTHKHVNWVFTKPGEYILELQAKGTTTRGNTVEAPGESVCFLVGTQTRPSANCLATGSVQGGGNGSGGSQPSRPGKGTPSGNNAGGNTGGHAGSKPGEDTGSHAGSGPGAGAAASGSPSAAGGPSGSSGPAAGQETGNAASAPEAPGAPKAADATEGEPAADDAPLELGTPGESAAGQNPAARPASANTAASPGHTWLIRSLYGLGAAMALAGTFLIGRAFGTKI